jgi:hypothetical protein
MLVVTNAITTEVCILLREGDCRNEETRSGRLIIEDVLRKEKRL